MRIGVAIVAMGRPDVLAQTVERATEIDSWPRIHDNSVCNAGLSAGVNAGFMDRLVSMYGQDHPDVLMHLDDDALLDDPVHAASAISAQFEQNAELGLIVPNLGNYPEYLQHNTYREIRWGLGFCWALRTSLYREIGAYDQQLIHQQECDLALRVRMAGYTVGAIPGFTATHNDPGGERSALSLAREHLGCVQFRDKWTSYFRGSVAPGVAWTYGTMPLYLMQHWPPDQDWYRRYAEAHGVVLNAPPPGGVSLPPGSRLGLTDDYSIAEIPRLIEIEGRQYLAYADLRNDYGYWATGPGYLRDREKAIARWFELTGEKYEGYVWPGMRERWMGKP